VAGSLTAADVEHATFERARRGFAEHEVRMFLREVAASLAGAERRIGELERALAQAGAAPARPAVRGDAERAAEDDLLAALGEETAAVLRSAKEAAADLREKAEQSAARLLSEAQEDAERMRAQAASVLEERTREAQEQAEALRTVAEREAEQIRAEARRHAEEERARAAAAAEAQVEAARAEAQEILDAARAERLHVVDDLDRRRTLLRAQIEELRRGRDGLIEAYRVVKRTFLDATGALARVERDAATGALWAAGEGDAATLPGAEREEDELAAARVAARAEAEPPADAGEELPAEAEEAGEVEAAGAGEEAGEVEAAGAGEEAGEVEAGEEAGEAQVAGGAAHGLDEVDSLFARLRAAQEELSQEQPAAEEPPAEAGQEPPGGRGAGEQAVGEQPGQAQGAAGADALARRDDAVADLASALVRRVKRAAQDEQNEILDAIRRHRRGRPDPAEVLEPADGHLARWVGIVAEVAGEALAAGAALVGGEPTAPLSEDRLAELAGGLAGPLRDRVVATLAEADDDTSEVLERIAARYREWKGRELETGVRELLLEAYAQGAYDAAPEGSVLVWLTPADGCSADCHDNALEPTARGSAFPTGHTHPPAYRGCRCLAVPAPAAAS
jgi:DivIVA domain-containing protein